MGVRQRDWKKYKAFRVAETCRHCGHTIVATEMLKYYECPCGALGQKGHLTYIMKVKHPEVINAPL